MQAHLQNILLLLSTATAKMEAYVHACSKRRLLPAAHSGSSGSEVSSNAAACACITLRHMIPCALLAACCTA